MMPDPTQPGFNGLPDLRQRLWDAETKIQTVIPPFSWTPPSALATWIIPHNLGRYPEVQIRLSSGEIVYTTVTHLDQNTCMVEFSSPVLATADLR